MIYNTIKNSQWCQEKILDTLFLFLYDSKGECEEYGKVSRTRSPV